MYFHWKAIVKCCTERSYRTQEIHFREKLRVLGVRPSGTYGNCSVLKAYDRETLMAFQPADHFAVPWPSNILKSIDTSHGTA
jgi:hypothetical protein